MSCATPFIPDLEEIEIEPITGTDTPIDPPETGDDGGNGNGEGDDENDDESDGNGVTETNAIKVTPAHDLKRCYSWLANGPEWTQWMTDQQRRLNMRMGV